MVVESVETEKLGHTASGSEIHAPLGSRTGRCELVRHFSVFIGAGAVLVFEDFVVWCSVVRQGPIVSKIFWRWCGAEN